MGNNETTLSEDYSLNDRNEGKREEGEGLEMALTGNIIFYNEIQVATIGCKIFGTNRIRPPSLYTKLELKSTIREFGKICSDVFTTDSKAQNSVVFVSFPPTLIRSIE